MLEPTLLLLIIVSRIVNSCNRSRPSRSQRVPPGKPFPEEVYWVVPRRSVICEGKNLFSQYFPPIAGIPRCTQVIIVGVTFQSNCRFNRHVKNKLIKANKWVHILRTLRKEGYNKSETNHLFKTLVLPNFLYVLAVYIWCLGIWPLHCTRLPWSLFQSSVLFRLNISMFTTFWKYKTITFSRKYLTL